MMPVCSDIQMDLQVNEILIILVQLLQNGHLYFFEKYWRYYARVLKNAKLSTIAPLIMMLIIMIDILIFCC